MRRSTLSQLLHDSHDGDAESRQPRDETDHENTAERFLIVANARVIGTRSGNANLVDAVGFVEILVAGPAAIEEGVEGKR